VGFSYAIHISFDYLNRVGRRIVRPERSECEIGLSIFITLPITLKPSPACDILSAVCCVISKLDIVEETRELLAVCILEVVVRALF
jgi:hypothetical protein